MALPIKKPYESLAKYLERTLSGEIEAGKSRGKATADIMFEYNKEPDREMFLPFIWGAAGNGGTAIVATGGTITQDGDYKVHTFTSNGTFEITAGSNTVNYLVQGGGGSGAKRSGGFAGGGAGGGIKVDSISGIIGSYSVVVGTGGITPAGTTVNGNAGVGSTFDTTIIGCGGNGGTFVSVGIGGGDNCDFTASGDAGASNASNATTPSIAPDGLFSSITGVSTQYGRGGDSNTVTPRTGVIGQGGNGGSDASIEPGDGEDGIVITRYYSPASGGGGGDTDADAYIAAVTTAGGTLSAGDETAIQTLYTELKSNSLYSELTFMYPFMGGTPNSHKVEGLAPTDANTLLTWYGGVSQSLAHTSAGVDKTVANSYGYGAPNFSPSGVQAGIDDMTMGAYISTAITNDAGFLISNITDATNANTRNQLNIPYDGNNVYAGIGKANFANYNNGSSAVGTWVASRTSSTSLSLYKNGSSVASNTSSNVGASLSTNNYSFLSADGFITSGNSFDGVVGFIFGANGLDGTQVGTFNTILQTYLTAIGR